MAATGRKRSQVHSAVVPARKKSKSEASETLYIKNLNDQVSIADLRMALYMLFSSYGPVVAINAHKSPRMRGQAHVAFGNVASASEALNALQGQHFLSKKLVISYAAAKSERLAWLQRDANRSTDQKAVEMK